MLRPRRSRWAILTALCLAFIAGSTARVPVHAGPGGGAYRAYVLAHEYLHWWDGARAYLWVDATSVRGLRDRVGVCFSEFCWDDPDFRSRGSVDVSIFRNWRYVGMNTLYARVRLNGSSVKDVRWYNMGTWVLGNVWVDAHVYWNADVHAWRFGTFGHPLYQLTYVPGFNFGYTPFAGTSNDNFPPDPAPEFYGQAFATQASPVGSRRWDPLRYPIIDQYGGPYPYCYRVGFEDTYWAFYYGPRADGQGCAPPWP